ncbi:sec-independent translocation protein MttA [Granulicella sp. WH15]|uniref:Sec-independent protein translocase subunit TatA/TatB n=1 Tax=Granulicella sp. WH15 TaxID=2602070 RepID=UPI001366A07A|nr:twin-arginine translocase TatA/TatE family subunit [Granulicella sp. WH15]QHN04562.1 sec-independent translocation protein MttA [Granulicella sp. WH15]
MPSLADSAFIFVLALLLFGPKKLPELARQLGKLMGEFRRASNEFRMQMEDELRLAEQAEQQKKIAALEAAAPVTPPIENTTPTPVVDEVAQTEAMPAEAVENHIQLTETQPTEPIEPLPIATSGDLNLMPPATGLPVGRGSSAKPAEAEALEPMLEAIPQTTDPSTTSHEVSPQHG